MTPKLLMTAAIAGLLGTSALAAPTAPAETDAPVAPEAPTVQLSSAEIDGYLGTKSNLPPNCEAFYFPDPVTGELVCNAVVCTSPGGWKEIFECSEFGL